MTTKSVILKAIRDKCIDCACHQVLEIRRCNIIECSLWPYRMGCDPYPARSNRNLKTPPVQEQKFEENIKLMVWNKKGLQGVRGPEVGKRITDIIIHFLYIKLFYPSSNDYKSNRYER